MPNQNRYERLIEDIFFKHFKPGLTTVNFQREDIERSAKKLRMKLPKNLGDIIYTFRYRGDLPDKIRKCAPGKKQWIIRPAGRSLYRFVATDITFIQPNPQLAQTKIPNATPGLIAKYALDDEQALLAKLRYNRLVDIFTGITCYSLQSHLRTSAPGIGQVETDEVYIGVDKRGAHYVFPVQAKGGHDKINAVQIEQDIAMCAAKFPSAICRPIAAQFVEDNLIALFELEQPAATLEKQIAVAAERHFRLVPPENLTSQEIQQYNLRTENP